MKPARCIRSLVAALLVLLTAAGPVAAEMTIKKEKELGRKAFLEIREQLGLVKDPDCVWYLRGLGRRLVALIPNSPFTYTFSLVDSPQINAFAIPGGYIFIFRGLVTFMDSEAELVSVVAHEIAHVKQRHLAMRLKRSQPVNLATMAGMLAGILLGAAGGNPAIGQAVIMGSVAGGIQKQLAFSREDEEQADYVGYKLMTALGYPARAMAEGFRKIGRREAMMGPHVATYLRTHPQSASRMDRIDALIRRHQHRVLPQDNSNFLRIKTRLVALYDQEEQAESRLRGWLGRDPHSPWPRYGLALLAMRRRNHNQALAILENIDAENRFNPYFLREQALCRFKLGQMARAQHLYTRVLARLPKDQEALYGMGQVMLHQGHPTAATRFFKRLVALNSDHDRGQHQLGVALGKLGRTGEASLHLGLAFKLRRNWRAARYHLGRAQGSPSLDPRQRAQAHRALKQTIELEKKAKKRAEAEQ